VPTVGTRALLTLTSFAPLWLGLALLRIPGGGWAAAPLYVLAAVSPLALWVYFRATRRIHETKLVVADASRRDQDILAYVATYLVPFAFVSTGSWRANVVLVLFLVLIIGLAVHARVYYVNPLLAIAGYRLFEIGLADGASAVLITRREHLPPSTTIKTRTLDQHVLIEA
jgi:hypothetical protein